MIAGPFRFLPDTYELMLCTQGARYILSASSFSGTREKVQTSFHLEVVTNRSGELLEIRDCVAPGSPEQSFVATTITAAEQRPTDVKSTGSRNVKVRVR